MSSIRLSGSSEKLGPVSASDEYVTWEVPDVDSAKRMRKLLKHMSEGSVVLDRGKFGGIPFGENSRADFIEKDEFAASREESRHQVRFGQMVLNTAFLREHPQFVAIKPYDDGKQGRQSLYREWAAHEYLNSLFDRQVGWINLGVSRSSSGKESIISEYDHDTVTLDRGFWADRELDISALRPGILQHDAITGANGLGGLHGSRMTHGDAQVKNLGRDFAGWRAIDLEDADILDVEQVDDPIAIERTRRDLSAFIESIFRVD